VSTAGPVTVPDEAPDEAPDEEPDEEPEVVDDVPVDPPPLLLPELITCSLALLGPEVEVW
jgi:hypothetical protein